MVEIERDLRFGTKYEKNVRLMQKHLENFKRRILAVDLGMKYGFAYLVGRKLVYGYNVVSPSRYASQLSSIYEFNNHIHIIAREMGGLDAIVFEEVHGSKGAYALQVNGLFVGSMLHAAKDLGARIVKGYQVGVIKKYATGNGGASKKMMIRAANEKYGLSLDPKEEDRHGDMADAIHLLSLSMQAIFNMGELSQFAREKIRIGEGTGAPV